MRVVYKHHDQGTGKQAGAQLKCGDNRPECTNTPQTKLVPKLRPIIVRIRQLHGDPGSCGDQCSVHSTTPDDCRLVTTESWVPTCKNVSDIAKSSHAVSKRTNIEREDIDGGEEEAQASRR
jgi:hypothetical protein